MYAQAAPEDGAKIQRLQSVGLEIGPNVSEQAGSEIVVVARPALHRVGGGAGSRARRVIGGIHTVGVQTQLVVPAFAVGGEGERQVLGLAVAACQREAGV